MIALFKNSQDEDELYYGLILTDVMNFMAQGYADVMDCKSLLKDKPDWKNSHITCVSEEDFVAVYDSVETMKRCKSAYFI